MAVLGLSPSCQARLSPDTMHTSSFHRINSPSWHTRAISFPYVIVRGHNHAGESPAESLKAESFPLALIGVRVLNRDGDSELDWDSLTFSFTQTDRMYMATCKQGEEWQSGFMQDFQNLSLSPAAGVINYGQGLFEGMKAQYAEDGNVVLFRPSDNARRSREGARRLGMPPVPEEMFLNAVKMTVRENIRWVPPIGKGALYVRPLLFGSGAILGVAPAPEFTFLVYVSPVGPYFKGGITPLL